MLCSYNEQKHRFMNRTVTFLGPSCMYGLHGHAAELVVPKDVGPYPSALDHRPALFLLRCCSLPPLASLLCFEILRPVIQLPPEHCVAREAGLVRLH